jgi:hypothetical protein
MSFRNVGTHLLNYTPSLANFDEYSYENFKRHATERNLDCAVPMKLSRLSVTPFLLRHSAPDRNNE